MCPRALAVLKLTCCTVPVSEQMKTVMTPVTPSPLMRPEGVAVDFSSPVVGTERYTSSRVRII